MISSRVIVAYSLMAVMVPVHAQPIAVQAEVLFREGRDLVRAGRVADGCASFARSLKLEPAITTLLNLAACHEKLGQLATAWALFLDAERQTRSESGQMAEQLYKIAHDRAAKLEPRVPKLTISILDRIRVDELEILRDRERITTEMWNRAVPVDGGTYTITARVPGAKEWSTRVTLASEADTKTVDIPDLRKPERDLGLRQVRPSGTAEFAEPEAEAVPLGRAEPSKPEKKAPDATKRRPRVFPIALGAGGVALLGGAFGFSLWGDSTYADAKAEMIDPARRHSLYVSANHKRYAAMGFAAAGVGCAGAAVWLYLNQRGAPAEQGSAHAARLMLTPTASGIGVAGWF